MSCKPLENCERLREIGLLIRERDNARAIARVLAHAYRTDNRPPSHMVTEALAYPVKL